MKNRRSVISIYLLFCCCAPHQAFAQQYSSMAIEKRDESFYNHALTVFDREISIEAPQSIPVLIQLGDLTAARKGIGADTRHYQRALRISESLFGMNDAHVARVLDCLARLYENNKRWQEALPLFERMIADIKNRQSIL